MAILFLFSLCFFATAGWMIVGFIAEYRRANGWPWTGEVPVMLIAVMLVLGVIFFVGAILQNGA